jgi:hypothetical protein
MALCRGKLEDGLFSEVLSLTLVTRSCSLRRVLVTHIPEHELASHEPVYERVVEVKDSDLPRFTRMNWYTPEESGTCI